MAVDFGRAAERADFERRRARFLEHWPWFEDAINLVFSRTFESEEPLDRTVFAIGRLSVEEFSDIMLLCANGSGLGALKLLRPLSERTITMMYLIRNPDEVTNFLDRHFVDRRKTLHHMRAAGIEVEREYSAAELATIEADYQRVRARYLESCRKCGATRDRGSWSHLNLADMTAAVDLSHYLTLAYYPTLQIHSTVTALFAVLESTEAGIRVKTGSHRFEADQALVAAQVSWSETPSVRPSRASDAR